MKTTSKSLFQNRKVTIVGAGAVGSTYAYALLQSGIASEIALIDRNEDLMKGQVLDLGHGMPFFPSVNIHTGEKQDYKNSQLIVITAGASQKPGETRLDLLKKNASIIEEIIDDIQSTGSNAVVLMVTNPVDVLTQVALKRSGWDRSRVIGSGTVLDSARFRYLISKHCGVDAKNVHAYIIGEHGDSEVAPWSLVHMGGLSMDSYCPVCNNCHNWLEERDKIVEQVRNSAYHIIGYKGATNFGVAQALMQITGAILRDQHSLLTVSVYLKGEYGLDDLTISVPCLVSHEGVKKVIEARLTDSELSGFRKSASIIKKALNKINY